RKPPRAPRQSAGQSHRGANDRMSRREDAPPVLEPNHRALDVLGGNSHPEEIVQGEELSIKRVAAPLVRHGRPQRRPVHIVAFRHLREIMKVPEVNSSAPVVALFEEVMYDPVQGTRLRGRNVRPQAIPFDERRGSKLDSLSPPESPPEL